MLVKLRKPPQMTQPKKFVPLVKVATLKPRDITMIISGFGTVSPKVQVEIVPQVSGKVVWTNGVNVESIRFEPKGEMNKVSTEDSSDIPF